MADKIQSMFGAYAVKMQTVIDKSLDKFAPIWFPKYFDWGIPTTTLTYVTAIGRSRIEAAASVVDRNAPAPTRSRLNLEKLSGTVPAIKESFRMNEEDYRNYLTVQNMALTDEAKRTILLDMMFNDLKKAGEAPLKRLDIMTLQALSTGKVSVNAATNPDGLVLADIDLLMPAANKKTVAVVWSSDTTATPITDIKTVVIAANALGMQFEKMLMTLATFWKLQKCAETVKMLAGYYRLASNQATIGTIDQINQYLFANGLPIIEIVNENIGIESDGLISSINPWYDTSVTFVPAGKLGVINNAFAIEQMEPVQNVNYATYQNVLLKKYRQANPWGEFTDCELNAFPTLSIIDRIMIMDVATTS